MIHYALRCGGGHEFDGWFRSSASFDEQAASGKLDCPVCASTRVTRALMAPRIGSRMAPSMEVPPQASPADAPSHKAPVPAGTAEAPKLAALPGAVPSAARGGAAPPVALPDHVRSALQRIRAEVEKHCEYVGPHFAREVRRMATKDEPHRPVYGEATPDEAAGLAEDGIDVTRIPWVPRADS